MPRPHRYEVANGVYHVTARAVMGAPLFVTIADRDLLWELIRRTAVRYGWELHACCLMTTHYHLIIQISEPNLGRGMQYLNGQYGRLFNERHGRRDALFGRRYSPTLIESEEHYETALAYVINNPVEAGLCRAPSDWPWTWCRVAGATGWGLTPDAAAAATSGWTPDALGVSAPPREPARRGPVEPSPRKIARRAHPRTASERAARHPTRPGRGEPGAVPRGARSASGRPGSPRRTRRSAKQRPPPVAGRPLY